MSNDSRFARKTPLASGPCWLILGNTLANEQKKTRPLSITLRGVGNVFPVFGSEEDALYFMQGAFGCGTGHFGKMASGTELANRKVIRTGRARLAAALCTTLKKVDLIAFDPLPDPGFWETVELASMPRGSFVDSLLGRNREWSDRGLVDRSLHRRKMVLWT